MIGFGGPDLACGLLIEDPCYTALFLLVIVEALIELFRLILFFRAEEAVHRPSLIFETFAMLLLVVRDFS